jgi:uncharacterized protein with HEPN domain
MPQHKTDVRLGHMYDLRLYKPIPRAQIVGLRNRLIDGYDNGDFDILWQISYSDLELLTAQLRTALASEQT